MRNNDQQDAVFFLSIYFNNHPLHVSNRLTILHQEVFYCVCSIWYLSCIYVDQPLARSEFHCDRASVKHMKHGPQNVKRILDIDNSVDFIVILSVSIILKHHITLSHKYKRL